MAQSRQSLREREQIKQAVISMYSDLEELLKSAKYIDDIRKELEEFKPGYLKNLQIRRRDLEKIDHAIVLAGQTSAGKTTLINKIVGKNIFIARHEESTATICKIRNSDRIKIIVEHENGEITEKDLTEQCNLETEEGQTKLREEITNRTDLTKSKDNARHKSVDIGFPISFLKGNTILVDTPGIGGSKECSDKLLEYLPNAVSFIFVTSVFHKGGLDRLPELLKEIANQQMDNEMPCFDPEDVIFLSNKWDSFRSSKDIVVKDDKREEDGKEETEDEEVEDEEEEVEESEDDDDEEKEEYVWNEFKSDIKEEWKTVKDENICKLSLQKVFKENKETSEFNNFMRILTSNIKKSENIRVVRHLRFVQELIAEIYKGVDTRIQVGRRKAEDQIILTERQIRSIHALENECKEFKQKVHHEILKVVDDIEQEIYHYMSTDEGKEKILNPQDRIPIMDSFPLSMQVIQRVDSYIKKYLQSDYVLQKFDQIKDEIILFYQRASSDISQMESDWTNDAFSVTFDEDVSREEQLSKVLKHPLGMLALAATVTLCVAIVGFTVATFPITVPIVAYLRGNKRKKRIIDGEYERIKSSVHGGMSNYLKLNHCKVIWKLLKKVVDDLLSNRIRSFLMFINHVSKSRDEIISNHNVYVQIFMVIREMMVRSKHIHQQLTEDNLDMSETGIA